MEQITHTSSQINTNAEKIYLTWNGKLILKSDFGQVPQDIFLRDNDTYLGIIEFPNSALGDKNKYIVAERSNKLIRFPVIYRAQPNSYLNKSVNKVWENVSIELHMQQILKWDNLLESNTLKHLYLATKSSVYG